MPNLMREEEVPFATTEADFNSFLSEIQLKWRNETGTSRRSCIYTKDSERTMRRKRQKDREYMDREGKKLREITDIFRVIRTGTSTVVASCQNVALDSIVQSKAVIMLGEAAHPERPKTSVGMHQLVALRSAEVDALIAHPRNAQSAFAQRPAFESLRLLCISSYLDMLLDDTGKMEASATIASIILKKDGPYAARCIRNWAKEFVATGSLAPLRQGQHVKHRSILADEDIALKTQAFARSLPRNQRFLHKIKHHLEQEILPEETGLFLRVNEKTLDNYMHKWGFSFDKNKQDVYIDGHERDDVQNYRAEFTKRMMNYRKRMDTFEGISLENVIAPTLRPGLRKLVHVTHDESTFSANDDGSMSWQQAGHHDIAPKGDGRSIMVTDFFCACHGSLKLRNEHSANAAGKNEARIILHFGANAEGYWTHEHLVAQLKDKAIPIFEQLHPGCQGVFTFDNSTNHSAMSKDALRAGRMTLGPKIEKKWRFRDGWYLKDGAIVQQPICAQREDGTIEAKDIRAILQERQLWRPSLRLDCKKNCMPSDGSCCARHLLAVQPDFRLQKRAVPETVEDAGHICEMFPKFHCELNFIERIWATSKKVARRDCDYSFDSLKQRVPRILDEIHLSLIRKLSRKCWDYMQAYAEGCDYFGALKQIKIYKSHRRISSARLPDTLANPSSSADESSRLVSREDSPQAIETREIAKSNAEIVPAERLLQPAAVSSPFSYMPTGMANLGNTCFMNAMVQCFLSSPPVTRLLSLPTNHQRACACSLCVLSGLWFHYGVTQTLRPELLKPVLREAGWTLGPQRDPLEFLEILLRPAELMTLFSNTFEETQTCQKCGKTKKSMVHRSFIPVDVQSLPIETQVQISRHTIDHHICSDCQMTQPHDEMVSIAGIGEILCLYFVQVDFGHGLQGCPMTTSLKFPASMTLCVNSQTIIYRLCSVLLISGVDNNGNCIRSGLW